MLCNECSKRNATLMINTNINGKQKTVHLCSQCASKLGLPSFGISDNLLSTFFNNTDFSQMLSTNVCPECGYRLEQLNQTGFLGCDKCYESFETQLLPVIKRIQGSTTHKQDISDIEQPNKIEKLKEELKAAIEIEEYERAAQIRDSIKALEKEVNDERNCSQQ